MSDTTDTAAAISLEEAIDAHGHAPIHPLGQDMATSLRELTRSLPSIWANTLGGNRR